MPTLPASIIAIAPLANGFTHLTLESENLVNLQPGHYFILNDSMASYAFRTKANQAQFILDKTLFQGNTVTLSAPMGKPFPSLHADKFNLVIAEDESLNACLFYLKQYRQAFNGIVFLGTQSVFPFYACPSRKIIPELASHLIASLPLLEDWGIANRLASLNEVPGCFLGSAEQLAKEWLKHAKKEKIYSFKLPKLTCL